MLVLDLLFFQSFGNAASNKCNDIKGMENLLKHVSLGKIIFLLFTRKHIITVWCLLVQKSKQMHLLQFISNRKHDHHDLHLSLLSMVLSAHT